MYLFALATRRDTAIAAAVLATQLAVFLLSVLALALKQLGAAVPACRVVDKAADDRLRELRVEARLEQGTPSPCPVMPPVLAGLHLLRVRPLFRGLARLLRRVGSHVGVGGVAFALPL